MSITFALRTRDGAMACTANHGACTVAEHLLDEDIMAYSRVGWCVECSEHGGADCPICGLELNVNNSNAIAIIERLGLEWEEYGTIDARELFASAALANVGRDDTGIDGIVEFRTGGSVWVEGAVTVGYFSRSMGALEHLATYAMEHDLVIDWG